jgi:high-affinity iron transporter
MRKTIPMVLALTGLIAAGCGGSSDSSGDGDANEAAAVSAKDAGAEIDVVRNGLAASLTAYRNGDEAQAEELATDAYLEHFELVERPLGRRDRELNERLEEQIRGELRELLRDGAPVARVATLVERIHRELDEAQRALGSG